MLIRCVVLAVIFTFMLCMPCSANENKTISVSTGSWPPYINPQGEQYGTAAELLRQLFSQNDTKILWQYQNYDLAYHQVQQAHKTAAYPYFRTPKRSEEVLFSAPIFNVTSHIYYNRQYNGNIDQNNLRKFRIGKVAGYSYGTQIDKLVMQATSIATEQQALIALLNNEIDYLPMTESVMNTLLIEQFPERMLLVKPLDNMTGNASLHLIAAKTPQGQEVISQLNQLLGQAKNLQSLQANPVQLPNKPDIARLVSAEGYPVILGQSKVDGAPDYFTLPQGTKVLVLQWSGKILAASKTDRLYKNMMDLSKVVVLNGPQVSKELYIRNMHIELQ